MIATSPGLLPNEAIYTAQFVSDVDCLFDSLNGKRPYPELAKPFRRCVSRKPPHHKFWQKIIPEIENWVFRDENHKEKKIMPFKRRMDMVS